MKDKSMKPANQMNEESEPYLGYSWALAMLVLYALKLLFPAEPYTLLWAFQIYILAIILGITIFTLVKRHKHFKREKLEANDDE